jgi:hypothetical protein
MLRELRFILRGNAYRRRSGGLPGAWDVVRILLHQEERCLEMLLNATNAGW